MINEVEFNCCFQKLLIIAKKIEAFLVICHVERVNFMTEFSISEFDIDVKGHTIV